MLHHSATIELREVRDQRPGRQRLVPQIVENLPSHLMTQRLENPVEAFRN
jgi:hypothetical protein